MQIAGRIVDEIRRRLEFLESVGLHYLSLDRRPRLFRAAKRSVFGSRRRSDRSCEACCMYSTNLQSGCIRAITAAARYVDGSCAIWAIRCSWWSTMRRRSSAPISDRSGPWRRAIGGRTGGQRDSGGDTLSAASLTGQYLAGTREIPLPKQRREGNGESIALRRRPNTI